MAKLDNIQESILELDEILQKSNDCKNFINALIGGHEISCEGSIDWNKKDKKSYYLMNNAKSWRVRKKHFKKYYGYRSYDKNNMSVCEYIFKYITTTKY